MKYGILLCILCLLLAGTASAISVNPVVAGRTIQPGAVVSVPVISTAPITFDSSVHGATVYLDGNLLGSDEAHSKTPVTDNEVPAGDHTATFRLAGYKDFVMNFHVDAGRPQTMYAQLQQSFNVAVRQDIPPVALVTTTPPTLHVTIRPVTMITTATQTFMTNPTIKPDARVSIASNLVRQAGGGQESRDENGKLDISDDGSGFAKGDGEVSEETPVITHIAVVDMFLGNIFGGLFGQSVPKPPVNTSFTGPTIPPGTSFVFDAYWVAPVIDHGATIYIGEERLNVTHALNQAAGTNPAAVPPAGFDDKVPSLTRIGWFQPGVDPFTVHPSKTIDLGTGGRYRSMEVDPSDFVGYYGTWYLLDTSGIKPYGSYPVFTVRDPLLHLHVDNAATGADVNGAQVTSGDQIRFSINKSIGVTDSTGNRRGPITSSANDGFLDIVVTAPDGRILTQLDIKSSSGSTGVADLQRICWDDPAGSPCNPGYTWNTGAMYGNGTAKYPPGTYTVQVRSKLNNMHNNYRNAGQLYVGKTVSEKVTFTLV